MNQKDTLAPLEGPPDQSLFWVPESTPFLTQDLSFTFEGLEREQASMSTSTTSPLEGLMLSFLGQRPGLVPRGRPASCAGSATSALAQAGVCHAPRDLRGRGTSRWSAAKAVTYMDVQSEERMSDAASRSQENPAETIASPSSLPGGADIHRKEDAINNLTAELDDLRRKMDLMVNDKESLIGLLHEAHTRYEQSRKDNMGKEDSISELKAEVDVLRQKMDFMDKDISSVVVSLQDKESLVISLQEANTRYEKLRRDKVSTSVMVPQFNLQNLGTMTDVVSAGMTPEPQTPPPVQQPSVDEPEPEPVGMSKTTTAKVQRSAAPGRKQTAQEAPIQAAVMKAEKKDDFTAAAWDAAVPFTLALAVDFNSIGDHTAFKNEVANDVATAANIDPKHIKVTGLRAGSVIVDMLIAQEAGDALSIVQSLEEQIKSPNSPLMQGKLTSKTKSAAIVVERSSDWSVVERGSDVEAALRQENEQLKVMLEKVNKAAAEIPTTMQNYGAPRAQRAAAPRPAVVDHSQHEEVEHQAESAATPANEQLFFSFSSSAFSTQSASSDIISETPALHEHEQRKKISRRSPFGRTPSHDSSDSCFSLASALLPPRPPRPASGSYADAAVPPRKLKSISPTEPDAVHPRMSRSMSPVPLTRSDYNTDVLPPGWEKKTDESTRRAFYVNHELKAFSWAQLESQDQVLRPTIQIPNKELSTKSAINSDMPPVMPQSSFRSLFQSHSIQPFTERPCSPFWPSISRTASASTPTRNAQKPSPRVFAGSPSVGLSEEPKSQEVLGYPLGPSPLRTASAVSRTASATGQSLRKLSCVSEVESSHKGLSSCPPQRLSSSPHNFTTRSSSPHNFTTRSSSASPVPKVQMNAACARHPSQYVLWDTLSEADIGRSVSSATSPSSISHINEMYRARSTASSPSSIPHITEMYRARSTASIAALGSQIDTLSRLASEGEVGQKEKDFCMLLAMQLKTAMATMEEDLLELCSNMEEDMKFEFQEQYTSMVTQLQEEYAGAVWSEVAAYEQCLIAVHVDVCRFVNDSNAQVDASSRTASKLHDTLESMQTEVLLSKMRSEKLAADNRFLLAELQDSCKYHHEVVGVLQQQSENRTEKETAMKLQVEELQRQLNEALVARDEALFVLDGAVHHLKAGSHTGSEKVGEGIDLKYVALEQNNEFLKTKLELHVSTLHANAKMQQQQTLHCRHEEACGIGDDSPMSPPSACCAQNPAAEMSPASGMLHEQASFLGADTGFLDTNACSPAINNMKLDEDDQGNTAMIGGATGVQAAMRGGAAQAWQVFGEKTPALRPAPAIFGESKDSSQGASPGSPANRRRRLFGVW